LMLLRMAVIALLVFAISRPSLPAANYAFSMKETLLLVGILLVAAAVYWGVMQFWRRQRLAHHVLSYRRSFLRGGTGVVALLLFLLLVAWPYQKRIAAEIAAPLENVSETLPVAGVFLFDTSLSMEYRLENKSRLDRAREIATAHLSRLPAGSRIAVADTSNNEKQPFRDDLHSVQNRIESLETHPVSHKLNTRLRTALQMQEFDRKQTFDLQQDIPVDLQADHYVREIYLFTDLAYSSWNLAAAESLRKEIERYPWIHLYVIDVGVENPTNTSLSTVELSQQTVSVGGILLVEAAVETIGSQPSEQTVELYVQNESGKLIKQGQQPVKIAAEGSRATVTFPVRAPAGPINQGEIRLVTSDPLSHDNVRYFTVSVQAPPKILLMAPSSEEARYLRFALTPDEHILEQKARYDCTYLPSGRLSGSSMPDAEFFRQFEVVCLINVRSVPDAAWKQLAEFVDQGGGLAVFLGMPNRRGTEFASTSYQSDMARSILPGEPLADLKFSEARFLDVRHGLSHPLFKKFDEMNRTAELTSIGIRRYWKVKTADGASVPATYTDSRKSPAFLERVHGRGRVVMFTTAVDWKNDWTQNWNDLPPHWTFVALADQLMKYLGRRTEEKYNFTAGDDVIFPLDPEKPIRRYFLRKPGFEQIQRNVAEGAEFLSIPEVDQLGHYQVVSGDETSRSKTFQGFSVNSSSGESDFTRLSEIELDKLLGETRYEMSNDIEGLTRKVTAGRLGKEVFSLVLLVMIVVFCVEHLVANRFYDAEQSPEHA
ncbi:MAG: VWA domain-containing protein, partial [Planctomycetes bacterium]|nr:VWA domain-containing protein [Planctomycetota bacterium]